MALDNTAIAGGFTIPRSNKRSEPRSQTQAFKVRVIGDCQRIYGYARDISLSGMQVRTFSLCSSFPKTVGDQVRIGFRLPDMDTEIECRAGVIWNAGPPEGPDTITLQGVRFIDLPSSDQSKIDEWMKGKVSEA